jgi:adenylate cyclase
MNAPSQSRKLAAILAADVAGYSRLMGDDEKATVQTLTEYRQVFTEHIHRHLGRVVDTAGDSVLATFESPVEAVECAVDIQTEIARHNRNLAAHRQMSFRIGINLGDVIVHEDGTVYGDGVNIAARLESLAAPGGISVSGSVFEQVENKLSVSFESAGEQSVKNIAKPVRAYRVNALHQDIPRSRSSKPPSLRRRLGIVPAGMLAFATLALLALGIAVYTFYRPPAGPASAGIHRLAVLPFANLSADPESEYFSDGITEEMISHLSKVRGLEVIARTSVMTYKGKSKKIDEIGRELRVGTILEGSVRKVENQIRVTAQLIDVANQSHLWSQAYDRELRAVFAIQSDIAKRVAAALKVKLAPAEQQQIEKQRTDNPEAHELYLRGLYHFNKQTMEGIAKSIEYYEQAIKKDPGYAEAYAWLAYAHEMQGWYGLAPEKEAWAKTKAMALKALKLDSSNAHALTVLGDATLFDWNWRRVESLFQRALSLNPNSAMAHDSYGILYLSPMGRHEEAIAEVKRAVELDPMSALYRQDLGWTLQLARQYDAGIEQFQKVLQMEPGMSNAHRGLGESYAYKGMYEKSIEAMQNHMKSSEGTPYALASLYRCSTACARNRGSRGY